MKLGLVFLTLSFSLTLSAKINLATYNIRNFDKDKAQSELSRTNKAGLSKIIKRTSPDLLAVQEIVNAESFRKFVKQKLPGFEVALSKCGGSGKQKLGFLYKKSLIDLISSEEDNTISFGQACHYGLRPAFVARFKTKHGQAFTAIALHLKAGDQPKNLKRRFEQYKILKAMVKKLEAKGQKKIILMGDFNTTGYLKNDQDFHRFIDFTREAGLYDFSQDLLCSSYWYSKKDRLFKGSLLDHILVSQAFLQDFSSKKTTVLSHCQKLSCEPKKRAQLGESFATISDHCPVVTNLQ